MYTIINMLSVEPEISVSWDNHITMQCMGDHFASLLLSLIKVHNHSLLLGVYPRSHSGNRHSMLLNWLMPEANSIMHQITKT